MTLRSLLFDWLTRRINRCTEGAALAELALTLPLLLMLIGASVEVSRAIYQYNVITNSVQDATRFLARRDEVVASGTCPPASNWDSVVTKARALALTGSLDGSGDFLLAHWTDPNTITVRVRCQAAGNLSSPLSNVAGTVLPIVEVSASVPFNDMGLLGLFGRDVITLSAEHSELGTGR